MLVGLWTRTWKQVGLLGWKEIIGETETVEAVHLVVVVADMHNESTTGSAELACTAAGLCTCRDCINSDNFWSLFLLQRLLWRSISIYRVGQKKWTPNALHITSSNIGRFLIFFHCYNLQKICNATVTKYPTTPQTRRYTKYPTTPQIRRYTTLWNGYVRK